MTSMRPMRAESSRPLRKKLSARPLTTWSDPSEATAWADARCLAHRMDRYPVPAPSSRTCFPATMAGFRQKYWPRCRAASHVRSPVVPTAEMRERFSSRVTAGSPAASPSSERW